MKSFILYTADNFIDGPSTGGTKRFIEIVEGFVKKNNQIHLFVPADSNILKDENIIRHDIKSSKTRFIPKAISNFFINYNKFRCLKDSKYNSFIAICMPYAFQAILLKFRRITFIVWEDFVGYRELHFDNLNLPKYLKVILKPLYLKILTLFERFVLLKVERIIVQCEYDKNITLLRHRKYRSKIEPKIKLIFNNVNPTWIEKQNIHIRKETYSSTPKPLKLMFIGNISDKRKGLHILLEAVEVLLKKNYKVELTIIGGGKLLNDYKKKYEFTDKIDFKGSHSDPMPLLAKSDLLIVPSLADSFPNTVMEGLYLGITVIGAKTGGIPEMLKYEELLFKPDAESLSQTIKNIIDKNNLEEYQQLCCKRKKDLTFDWIEEMVNLCTLD